MKQETYETLRWESAGGIGVLTFNRPQRLNAINAVMWSDLHAFFEARLVDRETRVLVLTGAGDGFCAGLDIKEIRFDDSADPYDPKRAYEEQSFGASLVVLMRRIPQPIIAAVNGAAAGGGLSFAMASDVRLASEEAKFRAAYINIGVGGADMGSSWFLPRLIGAGNAARYLLTGDVMDAREALRTGLVQSVMAGSDLMPAALAMAKNMASKSPLGLRLTKEALTRNVGACSLEDAVYFEDRNQALCIAQMSRPGRVNP